MTGPTIAVHGGAGTWERRDPDPVRDGVRRAIEAGWNHLSGGNPPLEAAVEAVAVLEDDPRFNAGAGSVSTRSGVVETDAGLMRGHDLAFGGVACLRGFKNPIRVARSVLERSPHLLLSGQGARDFAREQDHQPSELAPPEPDSPASESEPEGNTVGAVVRDERGRRAAATSTGGRSNQWDGRIGDTPIPGAGTYATADAACSATGTGEEIMRYQVAGNVCRKFERFRDTRPGKQALDEWMSERNLEEVGLIALGHEGPPLVYHRTPGMPHGWRTESDKSPIVRFAT